MHCGRFHGHFALAGLAEGPLLGIGDQIRPSGWRCARAPSSTDFSLGFVRAGSILGELEPLPAHYGLRAPGRGEQTQAKRKPCQHEAGKQE